MQIVKGDPCIIQAKNSQVKLHVPKGVHGTVLGRIHTNLSRLLSFVPNSECVVGPTCEFSYHPFIYGQRLSSFTQFRLQVPHIIKELQGVREKIRVRHINVSRREISLLEMKEPPLKNVMQSCFCVNEKGVNIFTDSFSIHTITLESIKCCCESANVHLFGSLKNILNRDPLTTIKVYFSSLLSRIKDYESVSTLNWLNNPDFVY